MAAETGPLDARLPEQSRSRDFAHWIVAIAAGKVFGLVDRARPVDPRAARMTLQADVIQLLRRSTALASERHDLAGVAGIFEMLTAGTVTGLAAATFESSPRISQKDFGVNGVGPVLGLDSVARLADGATQKRGHAIHFAGSFPRLALLGVDRAAENSDEQNRDQNSQRTLRPFENQVHLQ